MEKVRCMLSNVGLLKSFWAEAASTTCFLINHSPSTVIDKRTPQELWPGTPGSYFNLKIFGCLAYAHVHNGKLEPRSIKCVFLGYKPGVKGYKLWCLETKKVIISRDVIFNETAMLCDLSSRNYCAKKQHKSSTHVEFDIGLGSIPESTS